MAKKTGAGQRKGAKGGNTKENPMPNKPNADLAQLQSMEKTQILEFLEKNGQSDITAQIKFIDKEASEASRGNLPYIKAPQLRALAEIAINASRDTIKDEHIRLMHDRTGSLLCTWETSDRGIATTWIKEDGGVGRCCFTNLKGKIEQHGQKENNTKETALETIKTGRENCRKMTGATALWHRFNAWING